MFKRTLTLFQLLGFKIAIDWSWPLLALLIVWSLAMGVFPNEYPDLAQGTYWMMGISGALGLFGSLILHELSHSLVARRYNIPITQITLFIFGGVAHMDKEPPNATSEFRMAIAGPVASLLLSVGFYGAQTLGHLQGLPLPMLAVLGYLGFINLVLAVFNLFPAFPLDGGRMFRAMLWHWKGDLRWATQLASRIGSGFGFLLMILGVLNILHGRPLNGLWFCVLGLFLDRAASLSYDQLLARQAFEGEPIRRFMNTQVVTVAPDLSISEFVEQYVFRHLHDVFPVVNHAQPLGCIHARHVNNVSRQEWDHRTVNDLLTPLSDQNTIASDTDVMQALSLMNRTGNSRLLVMDNHHLVGIVALKDILKFLSLKLDLEGTR
ncbi:MAG: site-2 protease family protein [Nitrospirota bacterium]|jgi:Zn-dependent protease/CBS domain-containing protein|nr:site-2 protease family protein [Nitrospirota bacterium]